MSPGSDTNPAPRMFIDFGRQADIVDPDALTEPITVIGVGGIGSPTILALAKMGCSKITCFDADKIENHNLPSQLFRLEDLNKPKTEAMLEIVASFIGTTIVSRPEFFTGINQPLGGIVICVTDSMESRKLAFSKVKYNPRVSLFIDARMGGEVARIYAINPSDPDDIAFHEANLYDDKDASPERCTAKAIIYNVFVIAGLIANLVKRHATHQSVPKEVLLDLVNMNLMATD